MMGLSLGKVKLLQYIVFYVGFSSLGFSESLPPLFAGDRSWILSSFSSAVAALGRVKDPDSIDQIIEELSGVLVLRMFPFVYNKSAAIEILTAKRKGFVKDSKEYNQISALINAYTLQINYLSKEMKKNGLDDLWKPSESNASNLKRIAGRISYVRDSTNSLFIYLDSKGLATAASGLPADIKASIKKAIQDRVARKHAGSVSDYFYNIRSKFKLISSLAKAYFWAKEEPKLNF